MYKRHKKETEKALVSRFGVGDNESENHRPDKERILENLNYVVQTLSQDMEYYSMIDPDQIQEAIHYIKNQENIDLVTKKCQALEWKIADLKIEVNCQAYEIEELKSKSE